MAGPGKDNSKMLALIIGVFVTLAVIIMLIMFLKRQQTTPTQNFSDPTSENYLVIDPWTVTGGVQATTIHYRNQLIPGHNQGRTLTVVPDQGEAGISWMFHEVHELNQTQFDFAIPEYQRLRALA